MSYMMKLPSPEVISSDHMLKRLCEDMHNAKFFISLQAMDFDIRPPMREVINLLIEQASKGIESSIAFDWRAYVGNFSETHSAHQKLVASDVRVHRVGHPWIGVPIIRRSHVKLHVIDNIVYVGGLNLAAESFSFKDIMLRYESAELATIARSIQNKTHTKQTSLDQILPITDQTTLLIDGGRNLSSVILHEARSMMKNAEKVWYMSQFSPDRKLGKAMNKATHVTCKYNSMKSRNGLIARFIGFIDKLLSPVKNDYYGTQKIHAKIIVTEDYEGNMNVLTGSHNYSFWGVLFGTREVAIRTSDPNTAKRLIAYIEQS